MLGWWHDAPAKLCRAQHSVVEAPDPDHTRWMTRRQQPAVALPVVTAWPVPPVPTLPGVGLAAMLQYDFSPFGDVGAWLGRCNSRPAAQRYQQKAQEALAKMG